MASGKVVDIEGQPDTEYDSRGRKTAPGGYTVSADKLTGRGGTVTERMSLAPAPPTQPEEVERFPASDKPAVIMKPVPSGQNIYLPPEPQMGSHSVYEINDTEPDFSGPRSHTRGDLVDTVQAPETSGYNVPDVKQGIGCCGGCLLALSWILLILGFPIALCICLKVVQEYERAVIFRLGRLVAGGAKGPGLFCVIPCTDSYKKVDLRTVSFDVPPQEILSKDSVTIAVDAVVYYRVNNAIISITNVEDVDKSTKLLAQTTLRNVLGTKNLSDILADREIIAQFMQETLDVATDPWGVSVERVEIKDVRLPQQLQRAMAAEAEATREARAKVIAAEGEQKASRALKEAADIINESPSALQLRYLQTLNTISAEKNSTIIFPLPIDMLQGFCKK